MIEEIESSSLWKRAGSFDWYSRDLNALLLDEASYDVVVT